jgi:hypothetical protein
VTPDRHDQSRRTVQGSGPGDRITPADIEDKFRELSGDVDQVNADARSVAATAAAVGLVVVVVVAFWLGRRRGKRSATVIEIRRS